MELDEYTLCCIEETRKNYEFLTFVIFEKDIVVGIIQNETPKVLMIYQFDMIKTPEDKRIFLQYGDDWWWGSNMSIPINLFIGERFSIFESCLKGYPRKSIRELIGPTFSLSDRYLRRVRKKKIELIIANS
jgi:hypothetical protein